VHAFVDFHVDVAYNTNASEVCEIKFTYLLTYFELLFLSRVKFDVISRQNFNVSASDNVLSFCSLALT